MGRQRVNGQKDHGLGGSTGPSHIWAERCFATEEPDSSGEELDYFSSPLLKGSPPCCRPKFGALAMQSLA